MKGYKRPPRSNAEAKKEPMPPGTLVIRHGSGLAGFWNVHVVEEETTSSIVIRRVGWILGDRERRSKKDFRPLAKADKCLVLAEVAKHEERLREIRRMLMVK